jgi:hypothetical protein
MCLLLQLRVLRLRFFQDGDVGVGVFPEREEVLSQRDFAEGKRLTQPTREEMQADFQAIVEFSRPWEVDSASGFQADRRREQELAAAYYADLARRKASQKTMERHHETSSSSE